MTQVGQDNNRKTILIVEDSPVQAYTIAKLMNDERLNVLCAPNGRAGVSLAEQYLPDVIILDIEMPEMDGFEACRHLKKNPRTANIPVIMLTAHTEAVVALEGLNLGAIDFIPKDDFSTTVLLETLRQMKIL